MLIKCSSPMFVNTADFVSLNMIGYPTHDPVFANAKNIVI